MEGLLHVSSGSTGWSTGLGSLLTSPGPPSHPGGLGASFLMLWTTPHPILLKEARVPCLTNAVTAFY